MSDYMANVESIRNRAWADRPSPAVPLLLLGLVVVGGLIVALIRAAQVPAVIVGGAAMTPAIGQTSGELSSSAFTGAGGLLPMRDPAQLLYWVIASVAAYALALWVARRQGYRRGLWVNRSPLVVAGVVALAVAVIVVFSRFTPGDLLIRGNVPLLAIAVGIIVWAARERRPGLWVVAVIIAVLTLLANLYNMENLLFRLGVPLFANADEVTNLGTVAVVLLLSAAIFALPRPRHGAVARSRGAR